MKRIILLTLILIITIPNVNYAQVVRNAKEAKDNRQAIRVSKAQLERDVAQLNAVKAKVAAFENAFKDRQLRKVKALKKDIITDMHREIEESERKIVQDKKELGQSRSEVNSSRREVRRSRRDRFNADGDIGEGRDLRDDRRDKRDDRRDARDDKKDLEKQQARTARQKQILATLEAYTFSFTPTVREKALANKKLMHEFIQTMEADITETKVELGEDRIEKVEDGRERREDRRERRENLR